MFKRFKSKKMFFILMSIVILITLTGCDNSLEEDVGGGPKKIANITGNVSVLNRNGEKETIEGASIVINDNITETDVKGNYSIAVPSGNYEMAATYNYNGEQITQKINLEIPEGTFNFERNFTYKTFGELNLNIYTWIDGEKVLLENPSLTTTISNENYVEENLYKKEITEENEINLKLDVGKYDLSIEAVIDGKTQTIEDSIEIKSGKLLNYTAKFNEPENEPEKVDMTGRLMVLNPYLPEGIDEVQPESDYTIEVYQNGEKITETITDTDGNYSLSLYPGTYEIPNPYNPVEMIELVVQEGVNTLPEIEYELVLTDLSFYFQDGEHYEENLKNYYQVGDYNLSEWVNTSHMENITAMFIDAESFNQNINNWDISNVVSMAGIFQGAENYNQPLDNWNTSNIKNMSFAFVRAASFNQNINSWDMSKVEEIEEMFGFAISYNQPLNNWNTSNIENMINVFYGAENFNQDLSTWNFSSITSLSNLQNMVMDTALDQNNYNNLVDTIYNTNSHGWTIAEIESTIGTPNTNVSYTGSN